MSRQHVRDAWLEEVMRTRLVNDACRVLLAYMALACDAQGRHLMTEAGRIRVRREKLAEGLGLNPKRVTDRIVEATRAGLLEKESGTGHRGTVAAYRACLVTTGKVPGGPATFPAPSSLAGMLRGVVKLPETTAPFESAEAAPFSGLGEAKVPPEPAPQRAQARTRATYRNREQEPAPDDSREERDHDVASQAGSYRSRIPTRLNQPSFDSKENVA